METTAVPSLAGIHHLKLPVSDLATSLEWYRSRLGYDVKVEFVEQGKLMGYGLGHPAGGPNLALRLDPDRARAAAGFDYFAIGVPDRGALDQLARKLDDLGQPHSGVHLASLGWILPEVLDPDGHALRFYTMEHHTDIQDAEVTTIHDPRETAERRETAQRREAAQRPVTAGPSVN
jgi:catechol 2,3-dioxygenase-like lactoylglutathione lyase family enzyme